MKISTKRAAHTHRLIFRSFILSVSLVASQFVLLAQSPSGAGPLTVAIPGKTEPGRAVEVGPNKASLQAENAECFNKLAEETATYVQQARIPIKAGKGEYFSNNDAQAFLLSSVEKLKVSTPKPGERKIVSVINYKTRRANSVFYVIEATTRRDSIAYELKRDGRVLQSFAVKLNRPNAVKGPGVDPCPEINKQNAELLASLQSEANQTCQTRGVCIGVCSNNGASIAWTIIEIKPTNWKCFLNVSYSDSMFDLGWLAAAEEPLRGPLFDWTIWKAIRNDSALFF